MFTKGYISQNTKGKLLHGDLVDYDVAIHEDSSILEYIKSKNYVYMGYGTKYIKNGEVDSTDKKYYYFFKIISSY